MITLRVLKIGSKRSSVIQLDSDYFLEEVQSLINASMDTKSPLRLATQNHGVDGEFTFIPFDDAGQPTYAVVEVIESDE